MSDFNDLFEIVKKLQDNQRETTRILRATLDKVETLEARIRYLEMKSRKSNRHVN